MRRVLTIWPAGKDWKPGGNFRQHGRWLVLDITKTRDLRRAEIVAQCKDREDACRRELELRRTS